MPILGRQTELKILAKIQASDKAEFLAVYGRRRVGKTYLIDEYFADKGLFFEITGSKTATKGEQLRNFYREFIALFGASDGLKVPMDWGEAFHFLTQQIALVENDRKVILFFDELPWLASPKSGFLSALEYIWNRHWSRNPNMILIVCGSAAAWMIKRVIQNKGGLYGRLTAQLPLYPFTLKETELILKAQKVRLTRKQIIELYMVTGGVGTYLSYVEPGKSVPQVVNELCFSAHGQLFLEFNNLLDSLFNRAEAAKIVEGLGLDSTEFFTKITS